MAEPKDHATLLTALGGLRHMHWQLDLIGEGPLEEQLRLRSAQLGLDGRIHFRGFSDNPATQLAAAQIFVLASRSEAFPYSILEAMRAGLPVVASNVGGIPEAVVEGRTGFLVPAGDPHVLADRLGRLIADPALRQQLGNSGRNRFLRHFTFEQMFEKTFQIYLDVLGELAPSAVPSVAASHSPETVR
jgi:glycosyltransferase involved in cell wall biosynthesis